MGVLNPGHFATLESFNDLDAYWPEPGSPLRWDCIFVLPPWLKAWWQVFGSGADLHLSLFKQRGAAIGIAPLLFAEKEAFFIGSDDVCDCLDFVVRPGSEDDFFTLLLDDLRQQGILRLNLRPLRPESSVLTHLVDIAKDKGEVSCKVEDVSLELDLPATWEGYLGILNRKQRHEVRRKLRKLGRAGEVRYRVIEDSENVGDAIDLFLSLFRKSRRDKEEFMTSKMESFFRSLAGAMTQKGLMKICVLDLDATSVAAIMCFDYENTMYLYNSGFDPRYGSLSVGLISKILCIKDSIERGRKKFDFLRGAEDYKYRLGGKEIPLAGCQIALS